jgi:hypothetical protein
MPATVKSCTLRAASACEAGARGGEREKLGACLAHLSFLKITLFSHFLPGGRVEVEEIPLPLDLLLPKRPLLHFFQSLLPLRINRDLSSRPLLSAPPARTTCIVVLLAPPPRSRRSAAVIF